MNFMPIWGLAFIYILIAGFAVIGVQLILLSSLPSIVSGIVMIFASIMFFIILIKEIEQ